MTQPPVLDALDLEREYFKMNRNLSVDIVKYIAIGEFFVMFYIAIRVFFLGWMLWALLYIGLILALALGLKKIWSERRTHEKGITVFCTIFWIICFMITYIDQQFFHDPYNAYFLSYNFAIFERLFGEGIANLRHRIVYNTILMLTRFLVLPRVDIACYIVQVIVATLLAFMDLLREERNKQFFYSYITSREQLSKFKDLVVQHIPEAMVIVSQDLTTNLFMNKSFLSLVKSSNPNIIRSQLDNFILKDELNTSASVESLEIFRVISSAKKTLFDFLKETDSQILEGRSCVVTSKVKTSESEIDKETQLLFEAKLVNVMWDNRPSIAIILHDITEQHTIMTLKIADTQKDKILATVSHELKTPLNGMLGMIQIMEKKLKDSELLRFLTICKSSTNLLVSLVKSILDLNEIKANKLKLNIEAIDVYKLLSNIVSLFEYQCHEKGIYLKTKIAQGLPRYILTDKDRLAQVLINLVGNAHKFTSQGGITVSAIEEDENSVRFSIEDTGVGMLKEDKDSLFQIFGRASSETNQKVGRQGVGLGLTIADNLVRVLNNSDKLTQNIRVESEYCKGSRFSFVIKNRETLQQEGNLRSNKEENLTTCNINMTSHDDDLSDKLGYYVMQTKKSLHSIIHSSMTSKSHLSPPSRILHNRSHTTSLSKFEKAATQYILLVDDNLFNIAVAEHLVLSHGYKVKTALSGKDAIDLVLANSNETDKIVLILMDCQMPIMDGYEATKILSKMMVNKKIPTIPIVALTANDSEGDKEACRRAGMVDHLSKPLNDVELQRVLKKYS